MTPVLKAKWLEALRSWRYKQGKSVLRSNDDNWCCLGVLCDVSGTGEWVKQQGTIDNAYHYKTEGWENALYIPHGEYGLLIEPYKLANMNDEGDSFEEIATYIETKL